MTQPLPVLAEATPAPELRVLPPSLTTAISTAMVLVDYALAGNTTPTPEPLAVAQALPADLVEASHPIRAVLAHGTHLRAILLRRLPADHPGHTDWAALRAWLVGMDENEIRRDLAEGAAGVLGYEQPPGTTPSADEIAASGEAFRKHAILVLEAWGVSDAADRVEELLDPVAVWRTLLALLDAVWELWLDRVWEEQLPYLRAATDNAPAPPAGCGGTQWITQVTGLRPDPRYAEAADRATRVTLVPCPGLGRSLSLFATARGDVWFLFSPPMTHAPPLVRDLPRERTGISVQRLARLAPVLHALGDRTRLAIVLHLLDQGPLSMQQLTDALEVHQSTISRQVAALRKADVVTLDEHRHIVVNRQPLRQVSRTLLEALE